MSNFRVLTPSVWALSGEIDSPTVLDILTARYQTNPDLPLLFLIDSEGGCGDSTHGIIRELNPFLHLETRALGFCASAAVDLLLAGTCRTAHTCARFITHPATYHTDNVAGTDALDLASRAEHDRARWAYLYSRRTKRKKPAFWLDWFSKERSFDANEALRLGIIDAVLE